MQIISQMFDDIGVHRAKQQENSHLKAKGVLTP